MLANSLSLLTQTSGGADWVPSAEQPARVLVHGGLRAPKLPGYSHRVLEHVRAADHQRTVSGLDPSGRASHAVPRARAAQSARGVRAKVRRVHLL